MKLSVWAKKNGVTYRTAWSWFKAGKFPYPVRQLPSGTILVEVPEGKPITCAIYARVSSHDQKPSLEGQVARCLEYANAQGLQVAQTVTEIGSGLNGHRRKLLKLLADPKVDIIVVEHRDRLMRFGSEYVEAAGIARGARLLVVDRSERRDDLVRDMMEVLTSFCARLYGRGSARGRAQKALKAVEQP
jgi:Predicted site-specific integrase-resolvase